MTRLWGRLVFEVWWVCGGRRYFKRIREDFERRAES